MRRQASRHSAVKVFQVPEIAENRAAIGLMGHGRTVERRGRVPGKALKETVVLEDLANRLDVLTGHGLHRARHGRAVEDAHEVHSGLEAPTPPA